MPMPIPQTGTIIKRTRRGNATSTTEAGQNSRDCCSTLGKEVARLTNFNRPGVAPIERAHYDHNRAASPLLRPSPTRVSPPPARRALPLPLPSADTGPPPGDGPLVAREEAEERRVPDVVVAGESKGDAPAVAGGAGAASAFRRGPLMCACPGAWRWRWRPPAALAREDAEVLAEEDAGEAPDRTAPARTRDAAVAIGAVPPLLLGVEDAALVWFAWPAPLPPPPLLLPAPLGRDQLPPSRSSSSPSGYRRHRRLSSLSSGRRAPAPSTSPAADARRRDAAVAEEAAPLLA